MFTINRTRLTGAALAACAALIVAGCSSSDETATHPSGAHAGHMSGAMDSVTSSPGASAHNQTDIMFNQMMIPHHEQAIEMAELVPSRTDNPAILALATQIKNAQQPEIDQMTARLRSWGIAVDDDADDDMGGMHHGSMTGSSSAMGGMMSDAQMDALEDARGQAFDTLWLQGMITHHQGAITMADQELAGGVNPESRELATQIKTSQQAEIDQMNALLGR
ncbi:MULTISPECIES: DUF305 domain-containing protein [unclassified Gordonia (in: high G+C Gram-positive bacteria)]